MKKNNIKIIGDLMLDEWYSGILEKKSAEAEINIFERKVKETSLGGAGNLCLNLKTLGIKFNFFSEVGEDNNGKIILKILKKNNIKYFISKNNKVTTVKKRFFEKGKQIFREDVEDLKINKKIYTKIKNKIKQDDILIISDYQKGVISNNLLKKLKIKNYITFVDPKNKPQYYKDAFLVKPNMQKFEEWTGKYSKIKAFKLLRRMNWKWLVISNNKKGVHVFNNLGQYNYYRVKIVKKPNVIGAGDIFFAGIIYNYLKKYDIFTCVEIASYAATKCVAKKKIRQISKKDFKKDLVFTNGVFDTLHKGHVDLLKFSKKIGKKLILGVNTDSSVKKIKGSERPFDRLDVRIKKLLKTNLIDKIYTFGEKTPLKLIKRLRPDVIVKGDDYQFSKISGSNLYNVILFKKKNKLSSTKIISNLK